MRRSGHRGTGDLRPEYDLRELLKQSVKGKYARSYQAGTNLVLLDSDVRRVFRSQRAVNEALRRVIQRRKIRGGAERPKPRPQT